MSRAAGDREEAARGLFARGALEERQGRLGPARTSLNSALYERERLFGSAHPLVAETRAALARVDFAGGASGTALTAALGAEETSREHLRQTLRYLPERQALTFAEKRPRGLDLAISIVASGAALPAASVLDGVIQSRGLVLDELAARKGSTNISDPQVAALNVKVTQARQRFANLLVRSLQESVARPLLDETRQKKEEAERALAEQSAETRAEMKRSPAGFEAVLSALPPGSALVSFVQYARSLRADTVSFAPPPAPAPSFAAFIVRAGRRDVALIPLGTVAEIERLVTAWRAEAAGQNASRWRVRSSSGCLVSSNREPSSRGDMGSADHASARCKSSIRGSGRRARPGSFRCAADRPVRVSSWSERHLSSISPPNGTSCRYRAHPRPRREGCWPSAAQRSENLVPQSLDRQSHQPARKKGRVQARLNVPSWLPAEAFRPQLSAARRHASGSARTVECVERSCE